MWVSCCSLPACIDYRRRVNCGSGAQIGRKTETKAMFAAHDMGWWMEEARTREPRERGKPRYNLTALVLTKGIAAVLLLFSANLMGKTYHTSEGNFLSHCCMHAHLCLNKITLFFSPKMMIIRLQGGKMHMKMWLLRTAKTWNPRNQHMTFFLSDSGHFNLWLIQGFVLFFWKKCDLNLKSNVTQ